MRSSPEYEKGDRYLGTLNGLFKVSLLDEAQVLQAGTTLERTVQSAVREGVGDAIVASYTQDQIVFLRDLHSAYEIGVDEQFMSSILTGTAHSPEAYLFQPIYDSLSAMEAQAAELKAGDRVMHIGTGWPGTAIGMYRQSGTPVTCVEIDPVVAERSRQAVTRLGFTEDQLKVVTADGTTLNTEGYKLVVVSAMVPTEDKWKVIQNMRELANGYSDTLLLLRTPPDQARQLFYQPLPNELRGHQTLTLVSDTSSAMKQTDPLKSLIYHVKPMAAIGRLEDRLIMKARSLLSQVA